jgi:hypothetical protein
MLNPFELVQVWNSHEAVDLVQSVVDGFSCSPSKRFGFLGPITMMMIIYHESEYFIYLILCVKHFYMVR